MAERITLAEVVAALSLATDLAMGETLESGLAIALRAVALADAAGFDDETREDAFYVALLRHVGCTAENPAFAEIVGDEHEFRHSANAADVTSPRAFMPLVLRHLVRSHGLFGAAATLGRMARQRDRLDEAVLAVCEVAESLAAQLGLSHRVQTALLHGNERWDGKGFLRRLREDEIPASVRAVQVAECASVYHALAGADAVAPILRERAARAFDPRLAELFASRAAELLAAGEAPSLWEAALAAAPAEAPLHGERLLAALGAVAEFADLKSPFTVGHSGGVAELAAAAGGGDGDHLRQAGLVHDLGRVGVSSLVWEKPGPLSADEWERVRLHPYLGERILSRSPGLAALGATAARHHERCDGSGYHRGLDGRALPHAARVLAAADSYRAMTEPRPHRPAHAPEQAAQELRAEARAGRLDAEAVEAVVEAAGGTPRKRRANPQGLTNRELDVLRLLARGLATKQDRGRARRLAEDRRHAHAAHLRQARRLHARRRERRRDAARPRRLNLGRTPEEAAPPAAHPPTVSDERRCDGRQGVLPRDPPALGQPRLRRLPRHHERRLRLGRARRAAPRPRRDPHLAPALLERLLHVPPRDPDARAGGGHDRSRGHLPRRQRRRHADADGRPAADRPRDRLRLPDARRGRPRGAPVHERPALLRPARAARPARRAPAAGARRRLERLRHPLDPPVPDRDDVEADLERRELGTGGEP
ncbi:MAG TPA: HD domain-containing phosphohydrolase [Gaiellaceae bacterium]|nr:HD domain-containing phosphohydrolase [Gaiellaceae bacterium]